MNDNYDIIILVIANTGEIYDQLINKYWKYLINYIVNNNYRIKIFLLFGNNYNTDHLEIDNDNKLIYNIEDNLIPGILKKNIKAYEYINKTYNYKHVIRTNLSSFLIIDELVKLSNNLDSNNLYGSFPLINHGYRHYVGKVGSGAGFWLSRDNVEYILSSNINYNVADDIAIGKILESKKFTNLKRIDIVEPDSWVSGAPRVEISSIPNNIEKLQLLNDIIKAGHYHIRIKINNNRNIDVFLMEYFTQILYRN